MWNGENGIHVNDISGQMLIRDETDRKPCNAFQGCAQLGDAARHRILLQPGLLERGRGVEEMSFRPANQKHARENVGKA